MSIWCRADCSAGPLAYVSACAEKTFVRRGTNKDRDRHVKHGCLQRHNLALLPSGRRRKGAKRARGSAHEGSESAEETMEDEIELCDNSEEREDVISRGATKHAIMSYEQDLIKLRTEKGLVSNTCLLASCFS